MSECVLCSKAVRGSATCILQAPVSSFDISYRFIFSTAQPRASCRFPYDCKPRIGMCDRSFYTNSRHRANGCARHAIQSLPSLPPSLTPQPSTTAWFSHPFDTLKKVGTGSSGSSSARLAVLRAIRQLREDVGCELLRRTCVCTSISLVLIFVCALSNVPPTVASFREPVTVDHQKPFCNKRGRSGGYQCPSRL